MKAFLHTLLLLLFAACLQLKSQTPLWSWSNAWASNGDEIGKGVFVDSAGFSYQVGSFSGAVFSLPTLSTSANSGPVGTSDIFIAKIDKFGVPVWQVKAGGTGNDVATCVTVDNSGNVYVGGFTQSSNCVFYGSTNLTLNASISNTDFFVAKYNSSGSALWVNTSSGSGDEKIFAISCDNSFVYAGGYFTPNLTIPSLGSISSNGGQDMLVLKYNLAGTIIWAKAEGGSGTDVCTGISCDQSNVYLCGNAGNGITYAGSPNIVKTPIGATGTDLTFAKLNAAGDVQWAISEGNANNCSANSISIVKNNVVVGGVYLGVLVYSTSTLTANANNDMFFASHDRNGGFKNVWSAASAGEEIIHSVATDLRFIYVSGKYANTVNFGGTNGVATSTSNLFVACYDTLFNLQFVKFGTGNSVNQALACHSNKFGVVSITGSFNGNSIQFAPLSVITPSITEDFFVANLTNCSPVSGSTITGNQSTCFGTPPTVFSVSPVSGGDGTYSYTWEQSANSLTWAPADGTNSLNIYSAPSLTQTTYYRRIVTSCVSSNTSNVISVTVVPVPTSAASGPDQLNLCGVTNTSLSANTPVVGTGSWVVISGNGGSFTSATNPTTTFNGLAGNSYTLQWTISNAPCAASFDDVRIVFNQLPSTSAAGPDQPNLCGVTSTPLSANIPAIGTGSWTVISGSGGSFVSATNPTTTFNGLAGNSYTLQWVISNTPCTASFDDVRVVFNQNPSTANAGVDQSTCASSIILSANVASIGTGSWAIVSGVGGTFLNVLDPASSFNGLSGTSYTLAWTISNASCIPSFDEVAVVFYEPPTLAKLGADEIVCGNTITLVANSPVIGTGTWSRISGAGDLIAINSPTTLVTNLNYGLNEFVWKISTTNCPASADTIGVLGDEVPSQAIAGNDLETALDRINLDAETPLVGIGKWSLLSGPGIFDDEFNPKTGFTFVSNGQSSLLWTVSNGVCKPFSDTIVVNKLGFLVPEIITPNNDGNNDYFYLLQADYFSDIKLDVYNRWGSLEYSNSNYKNEFNGKNSKGVDLADDTYFILLSIPGQNVYTGYLIIKRR